MLSDEVTLRSSGASSGCSLKILWHESDHLYSIQIARVAVYSLHKTSTRNHIQRVMGSEYRGSCKVLAQLRYDLPASYAFHK